MIDNYGLWERHDAEQEAQLERCPKCEDCGEYIQDDYLYDIDGIILCEQCMNKAHRKDAEQYKN